MVRRSFLTCVSPVHANRAKRSRSTVVRSASTYDTPGERSLNAGTGMEGEDTGAVDGVA